MKSINVWVIDIATIKVARASRGIDWNLLTDATKITETRFMWIPGARPVNVPAMTPMSKANNISNIIVR